MSSILLCSSLYKSVNRTPLGYVIPYRDAMFNLLPKLYFRSARAFRANISAFYWSFLPNMLLPSRSIFSRVGIRPILIILPHDLRYGVPEFPLHSVQLTAMNLCNITQGVAIHDLLQGCHHAVSQPAFRNQAVKIHVGTLDGLRLTKASLGVQRRPVLLARMIRSIQLAAVLQLLRHNALLALGQIRPLRFISHLSHPPFSLPVIISIHKSPPPEDPLMTEPTF